LECRQCIKTFSLSFARSLALSLSLCLSVSLSVSVSVSVSLSVLARSVYEDLSHVSRGLELVVWSAVRVLRSRLRPRLRKDDDILVPVWYEDELHLITPTRARESAHAKESEQASKNTVQTSYDFLLSMLVAASKAASKAHCIIYLHVYQLCELLIFRVYAQGGMKTYHFLRSEENGGGQKVYGSFRPPYLSYTYIFTFFSLEYIVY
jgi:hypothetical protein